MSDLDPLPHQTAPLRSRGKPRRVFLQFAALGLVGSAAVALTACGAPSSTPAPAPTTPPKPAAQPTQPAAAQPPAKPAAQPTAAPKPTQPPAQLTTLPLKMGITSFQFVNLPVVLGEQQGFFKDQKIDVELFHMDATATLVKALLAKEIMVAEMDASAQISAIASGANAKLIGLIRSTHHYMVAAKKEINSLRDLIGKNVAVSQPNSAPNIVLELLLRAENIDPESMNQVSVGGSANRAKALVAGTVDATLFGVDEMDKVEADPDAKVLLLVKDVLPKFVGGAVMMHGELLSQPGASERVMEALVRSVRFCFENKDACVKLAVERTGNSPESAARTWDFFAKTPLWEPNAIMTPDQVDYLQEVNLYLKTQEKKLPLNEIIDMTGAEKVIAKLGRYTPKA